MKWVLKYLLCFFSSKDITMTTVNISASEPQKPATPAQAPALPQQQTQGDAPKPADKPSEQQK
jgi:hypothetical protein